MSIGDVLVGPAGKSYRGEAMQARHHVFTLDQYLAQEQMSGGKHEFLDGQVWAMTGGTREHALYAANVSNLLSAKLRNKRCAVHSSDLRIAIKSASLYTYADVTVICGGVKLDPEDRRNETVTNPKVVVEVLSPSTEDYDRGRKLGFYKTVPSLEEVVFVAHDRREIEVVRREKDGSWSRHVSSDGDEARLASLQCTLSVAEVYRDPLATKPRAPKKRARQR